MDQGSTFVGLDVHRDTIAVAVADGGGGAPRSLGTVPNEPGAVAKLVRKLGPVARRRGCSAAGPGGDGLYRQLTALGVDCVVVAPSLVPTKPGARVTTDRRDAAKLARLPRSGELTAVWGPDAAHAARRDLTRAREDARQELHRARPRLGKCLRRLGKRPPAGVRPWTLRHRAWLAGLRLERPAPQAVLRAGRPAIEQAAERLARLADELAAQAQAGPLAPVVAALMARRGVALVTAATLVAELGDLTRFENPRQLMAYAGLVPSAHSSGGRARRGGSTKTGHAHVRPVVVAAAWHDRHPPAVRGKLRQRQVGQPPAVTETAWTAPGRRHGRWRRLLGRGKLRQQAVVAVARARLGCAWAIARAVAAAQAAPAARVAA